MDMVGEGHRQCGSIFEVLVTPDSFPHFFSDLVSALALDIKEPGIDPYFIYDWMKSFTPIECVWQDIRFLGLLFYPQYPVDRYWIDFADPIKKIGIEVYGKQRYETNEQVVKDEVRIRNIKKHGYKIFIIKGKETFNDKSEFIIRNLCCPYYGRPTINIEDEKEEKTWPREECF